MQIEGRLASNLDVRRPDPTPSFPGAKLESGRQDLVVRRLVDMLTNASTR